MRVLFVSMIAVFACFTVSCCGSSALGTPSATKAVLDDSVKPGDTSTTTTTKGGDDGKSAEDPDYIFYDSEGDDFDKP
jgi:hypothetical protein